MRIIVATCTVTSVIRSGCSVETLFDNSEKEKCLLRNAVIHYCTILLEMCYIDKLKHRTIMYITHFNNLCKITNGSNSCAF